MTRATTALVALAVLIAGPDVAFSEDGTLYPTAQDRGDHVLVVVPGVEAAAATVSSKGDRIVVRTTNGPLPRVKIRVHDDTVKYIRAYGGRHPLVTVQLRHGRTTTERLGNETRVETVGNDLHIIIPRTPSSHAADSVANRAGTTTASPEPQAETTTAAATASQTDIAPIDPNAITVYTDQSGSPAGATTTVPATSDPTTNDEVIPSKPDDDPLAGIAGNDSSGGTSGSVIVIALLIVAGCGALAWWNKRKRSPQDVPEQLTVLASRSLGAKAKIVLISAGDREVLLSVGEKGPSLLAQWPAAERELVDDSDVLEEQPAQPAAEQIAASAPPAPPSRRAKTVRQNAKAAVRSFQSMVNDAMTDTLAAAPVDDTLEVDFEPVPQTPKQPPSPAIAGLLKLRDRLPGISPECQTDDPVADAEWARELLAATRGRREVA